MSDFSFLTRYVLPSASIEVREQHKHLKHFLFPLDKKIIEETEENIFIPVELKKFYQQVGYGFFFQENKYSINTFLDPDTFKSINLRSEPYEFDPSLDLFEEPEYQDKLVFFELNEGTYLLIDKNDIMGKNSVYYFDEKIANSLEEFLRNFDANSDLLDSL